MSTAMRCAGSAGLALLLLAAPASAGPTVVREFTTNGKFEGCIYHLVFEKPERLLLPNWGSRDPQALARLPRLCHDDPRFNGLSLLPAGHLAFTPGPLQFVGRWPDGSAEATFRLRYAVPGKGAANDTDPFDGCEWVEELITLNRDDARSVSANNVDRKQPLRSTDVVGLWAAAQQAEFARLGEQAPDFPFYQFAQVALSRKYGLPVPAALAGAVERQATYREVFEVFTGSASITESLQTRRLIRPTTQPQLRTVPVQNILGIDLAEHPWAKMMGNKQPDREPLAELVPADNYYARFRSLAKVLALGDWVDLWGGNLLSAFEYRTRHFGLRERYERQLCLPLERLEKALPKGLLIELAVTGNDVSVREGTDITVLFRVGDTKRFKEVQDPFVAEARAAHPGQWREWHEDYGDAEIETFGTPAREVSLYRSTLGNCVVVSNSLVALRRVLDTWRKKEKALAQSLDFQYMRTCFRVSDPEEDGFAFLSDAFIRRLVGPATFIKQLRRAEALAAVRTATDAHMLVGWLGTSKATDFLREGDLLDPDGWPVIWSTKHKQARSEVYGTLQFATPLAELPVGNVTRAEADAYESFRREYLRLWTRFSDPVGLRFRQTGMQTRMEAYILPVIRSQDYDFLRNLSQGGTVALDPGKLGPNTVLFFLANVNGWWRSAPDKSSIYIRLDDSPLLKDFVRELIQAEREGRDLWDLGPAGVRQLLQLPVVLGVEGQLVQDLKPYLSLIRDYLHFDEEGTEDYRGITINGRKVNDETLVRAANAKNQKERFHPRFYYAEIGEGLYFSFRKELIKQLIDRHKDGKNGKPNGSAAEANATLLAVPHVAPDAREAINMYLEWQTHRRALPGNAVWQALYRSGVIPEGANEADEAKAARHYLGYLPVSPDGSAYLYDRRSDETFNRRHGSYRQPQLRPTLAINSPVRALLEEFQTVRIDLRFREDGIHTTLTWERKPDPAR